MGSYIDYIIISRTLHIRDYVIYVRPFIAFRPYFQIIPRTCTGFEYFHVDNISICSTYYSLKFSFPGHVKESNTFIFDDISISNIQYFSIFSFPGRVQESKPLIEVLFLCRETAPSPPSVQPRLPPMGR